MGLTPSVRTFSVQTDTATIATKELILTGTTVDLYNNISPVTQTYSTTYAIISSTLDAPLTLGFD